MCWFQKDPHKVDNSFFIRWQEGPSLVEARSGHTSFVTSQVGRWSCVRWDSNYVHALILTCAIDVLAPLALITSYLHQDSIHPSFLSYITYTRAFFWSEVVILRARRSWYGTIKQWGSNTTKYVCDLRNWRGQLTILWKHCSSKETSVNLDDKSSTLLQKMMVVSGHLSSHFVYCVSISKLFTKTKG